MYVSSKYLNISVLYPGMSNVCYFEYYKFNYLYPKMQLFVSKSDLKIVCRFAKMPPYCLHGNRTVAAVER